VAYGNSLGLGLAVDAPYMLSNSRVASFSGESLRLMFTKPYWWPLHSDDLYRPVTLLSFALAETWEHMRERSGPQNDDLELTLVDYERTGGVRRAVCCAGRWRI